VIETANGSAGPTRPFLVNATGIGAVLGTSIAKLGGTLFVGNDSGPGHIASCLHIPHLIIGRSARHMRFWRPGWLPGAIVTPPSWIPNFKGWRIRENYWQTFVGAGNVIKKLKTSVLNN
jgi:hypothetical protein